MKVELPGVIRDEEYRRLNIQRMLRIWYDNDPEGAEQFFEKVKDIRSNLLNSKGMSKDGTLCEIAEYPQKIEGFMNDVFGKQWKNDVTRKIFLQEAACFRVNTSSMPQKFLQRDLPYAK